MYSKKEKFKKAALILVGFICVYCLLQVFYGTYIGWEQERIAREAKEAYEQAKSVSPSQTPKPTPKPTPAPVKTPEPTPPEEPEAEEKTVKPEFDSLMAEYNNEDIIGYLEIEGTTISYPVLRYTDNEFYLNRDINKNNNIAGSIFLDYENDISKEDKNMIIYGHNMKQDIMFHSIRRYADEAFYNEHKYIKLDTLYDSYVYEIFSYYVPDVQFPYIIVNFPNDEFYPELLAGIKSRAAYDTGVEVTAEDRILSLSTCSNVTSDTRMVVSAKLISVNGRDYQEIVNERKTYIEKLDEYHKYLETTMDKQELFNYYGKKSNEYKALLGEFEKSGLNYELYTYYYEKAKTFEA